MKIKVFISHKECDTNIAEQIAEELKQREVEAYLDTLDRAIDCNKGSEKLTNYLKLKISECSDILVVMSDQTRKSWWVPFEIGIAADQDKPIVTYLQNNVVLPEYLDYWPRLRFLKDIKSYTVQIHARNRKILIEESRNFSDKRSSFSIKNSSYIDDFYTNLKKALKGES